MVFNFDMLSAWHYDEWEIVYWGWVGGWVMSLAEESKIPHTVATFLPQRWRQASLVTAHLFQEVQEVWLVWTPQEIPVKEKDSINTVL